MGTLLILVYLGAGSHEPVFDSKWLATKELCQKQAKEYAAKRHQGDFRVFCLPVRGAK